MHDEQSPICPTFEDLRRIKAVRTITTGMMLGLTGAMAILCLIGIEALML
jgi:hypothetical protein